MAGVSEALPALLVTWGLESCALLFAELGVERVSDIEWVLDSDINDLQIPTIAKRKAQAMVAQWREQNAEKPAQKKVKREEGEGCSEGKAAPWRAPPLAELAAEDRKGKAAATEGLKKADTNAAGVQIDQCQAVSSGGDVAREAAGAASGQAFSLQIIVREIGPYELPLNGYTLAVFPSDTILSVKRQLWEKGEPRENMQRLSYDQSQMENESTLADYGIVAASHLHLSKLPPNIGERYVELGKYQIFVKGLAGGMTGLNVVSSDTVEALKTKVAELLGRPASDPEDLLRLKCEVDRLDAGRTLADYGIRKGSTVEAVLGGGLKGDIGEWGEHADAVGTRFLRGARASPGDARAILRGLGVASYRMFESSSDAGVDARARGALMLLADSQQPPGLADFKLKLSRDELAARVGEEGAQRLEALFRAFGGEAYTLWLRRFYPEP